MVALEHAAVAFVTYTLSLIAALSWNVAVQDEIKRHDRPWKRWVYAIGITLLAITVITLIVVFHDSDDRCDKVNSKFSQNKNNIRLGRISDPK